MVLLNDSRYGTLNDGFGKVRNVYGYSSNWIHVSLGLLGFDCFARPWCRQRLARKKS